MQDPKFYYRKSRISLSWRLRSRWTLFVWLALAVLAGLLYRGMSGFNGTMGAVETYVEVISPLETSRLVSLAVLPGQHVKAGDALAQMDTSLIEAERAVEEARAKEEENTIAGYQESLLQALRTFEMEVRNAGVEIETLEQRRQMDAAELGQLKIEQQRRDDLYAKHQATDLIAAELRPRIAALEHAAATYPELAKRQQERLDTAAASRDDLQKWLRATGGDAPGAIRQKLGLRMDIYAREKLRYDLQKDHYTLRANKDGIVSEILVVPGDVIQAGQPVMRMVWLTSDIVWGFLPAQHVWDVKVGEKMNVWRPSGPGGPVLAEIEAVAPEVQTLPTRVNPIRTMPLRGRRIMLRLLGKHDFIPGETVRMAPVGGRSWFNFNRQAGPS